MKKDTKEIFDTLSSGPVQRYILENENQDIRELVLKNKVLFSIPAARLSEQIGSRRKAKAKLSIYYDTPGIIYPPSENFEQSSSQDTAVFKSELLSGVVPAENAIGADLTGGFGVDSYFLSKIFKKIHYVEPQSSLLEIARHNHKLLGAGNIEYHAGTAEDFLASTSLTFNFIFLDPSRRSAEGKRIHSLSDAHPDILKLKKEILNKTAYMLVKASPLLDIQAGAQKLSCVRNVFVVSLDNECRELLFLCERDFEGVFSVEAVNLSRGRTAEVFSFTFPEERRQEIGYVDPLQYLYEPNSSVLKAGAFKSVATRFNLSKIAPSTHLYTSGHFIESFPGKKFEIEKLVKPAPSEVKAYFPEGKANVTTRNYPLSPEALRKKTGLKDGGDKFLIGFSGQQKKFLAVARRL